MSHGIIIGLGSNLGDRRRNIEDAVALLGWPVVKSSSLYETEPVDYLDQPWFLNAVIWVDTGSSPDELLAQCQNIENQLGRIRDISKGPRIIDLDLLFYNDLILNQPRLTIPHPEIPFRRFVLEPLAEIIPDFVHPVLGKTVLELLQNCSDRSKAWRQRC